MFLPPKLTTIILSSLISTLFIVPFADGQQPELENRIAAMEKARQRAMQSVTAKMRNADAVVGGSIDESRVMQAQATRVTSMPAGTVNRGSSSRNIGRFVPRNVRTAQLVDETVIDGGSPIVGSGTSIGEVYETVTGDYYEGETIEDGCSSCGDAGGYFCGDCFGRGGCPQGPCWLSGFGEILCKGEYFIGATAFRSPLFSVPGVTAPLAFDESSQGFYGGFNFGIPLCRISCGLFSGQFGLRSVNTNFDGNVFTTENRNQLFLTTGFYRRVDSGFQFGVVADLLHEEWITEADVVQLRGDFGRVYPSGATIGFRFATNIQDDVQDGVINGIGFTDMLHTTDDNYRFYWRRQVAGGGYGELFGGWTDSDQGIIGLDFDLPLAERVGMQAGFTYYTNDDGVPANINHLGGNQLEGYNLFVGLTYRPQGRSFYQNYDRPMFSVADNGTMMLRRR